MKPESDLTTFNISLPRPQQDDLERKLIAGLESSDPIEITPEYWERKRRELVERHARMKT